MGSTEDPLIVDENAFTNPNGQQSYECSSFCNQQIMVKNSLFPLSLQSTHHLSRSTPSPTLPSSAAAPLATKELPLHARHVHPAPSLTINNHSGRKFALNVQQGGAQKGIGVSVRWGIGRGRRMGVVRFVKRVREDGGELVDVLDE